ncbi:MAG: AsmA-like C-terminal region-containing protein [Phycisphaerales bacterium]|jgi:hypothetical protein
MPVNLDNTNKDSTLRKKPKRRWLWVVIAIVILSAAFEIAEYFALPRVIRKLAETTNTQISAESVDLRLNGSVLIKNLQIKPKQQQDYDNTIFRAGKVYVRFGLKGIVLLKPRLRKISVKDFMLDLQQDLDTDKWNIGAIKHTFSKSGAGKLPTVRFRNGKVNYFKVTDGQLKVVASVPIDVRMQPIKKIDSSYEFEVITAKGDTSQANTLKGTFRPGMVTLTGDVSSEDLPIFENSCSAKIGWVEYSYDEKGNYQLTAVVDEAVYEARAKGDSVCMEKPRLLKRVGALTALQNIFDKYEPSGTINVELRASGNLNEPGRNKIKGTVNCKSVRIKYRKFPYVLDNIAGLVEFTEKDIKIGTLRGRHGNAELDIGGKFTDFGPAVKGHVEIASEKMLLDDDLYQALSPSHKRLWNDFEPTGTVAFKYNFDSDTGRKKYALDAELTDVNSTYKYFPYPLEHLTGNLFFDHNSVSVANLHSQKSDRSITINGKLYDTNTKQPGYDLVIDVENVALDETLAAALPGRQQNLYRQFEPAGVGSGKVHVYNRTDEAREVDFIARLNFENTSLKPRMLSQPITDIKARAEFRPDKIVFEEFDGKYGLAPVAMRGTIQPTAEGDRVSYEMILSGKGAELGKDIFELVPQDLKGFIVELEPSGQIDYSAQLKKDAITGKDYYEAGLVCDGVTIRPKILEMPLKNIRGNISITPNRIALHNVTGDVNEQGGITLDGQISLNAETTGESSAIETGAIRLNAERLKTAGLALRKFQADISYDKQLQQWLGDNLAAKLYGGWLAGKFGVSRNKGQREFELQVGFQDIDLQRFLADRVDANQCPNGNCYSSGTMLGSINVKGTAKETESDLGRCRVSISNMQIGKLSPMAKLLTVLKFTKPSDYAFENMSFDGYIKQGKIHFKQFNLYGKTISFNGTGWMGLEDKNISLILAVRGPRLTNLDPRVIGALTDALSPGVLQMDVSGNVYEPQIKVKPLPVVKGTLELLGTPDKKSK